jgi:hypothetical protein
MTDRVAWELLGKLLMTRVRDQSIKDIDMIISGQAKGIGVEPIQKLLSSFDKKQLQALHELVPEIIDITLHNLLWLFEEAEFLEISIRIDTEVVPSLRELSYGGLHGDLYEWIPQFSQERYNPPEIS